ncbi:hypothetical protein [Virgisporangium ochraceum]|uniref:Uncharacterized protein n=1 Tax=Virgisporangium ochraceum TaxID=65505 RepID=A0A8J3ZZF8_9ACTN|nr:hypothetical protein [Virgisporangium ochraceum]GIJ72887.1 hypothetical protein Voc01_078040 [Virgisporangium ochraceum]
MLTTAAVALAATLIGGAAYMMAPTAQSDDTVTQTESGGMSTPSVVATSEPTGHVPTPVPTTRAPRTGPPRVVVSNQGLANWAIPRRMTDADLESLNAAGPPGADQAERHTAVMKWLIKNGGAEIRTTDLTLTVTAVDPGTAITGVRARVKARGAVHAGGALRVQQGGEIPPLIATLDLDGSAPAAPEFDRRSLPLEVGRSVEVVVMARVSHSTVSWDLILDISAGGIASSITVDHSMPTLRTTAVAGTTNGDYTENYKYEDHYQSVADYGDTIQWAGPS